MRRTRNREAHGRVEIVTRSTGRTYVGYFKIYEDGKWKRKGPVTIDLCSKATKGEAERKLREEIIPRYKAGGREPAPKSTAGKDPSTYTFKQAADTYYNLCSPRWGRSMRSTMRSIINRHMVPKLGTRKDAHDTDYLVAVGEIKPTDVIAWLNLLAESEESSHSMLKKCLTHIRGIFDVCVDDDVISKNPARAKTVKRPRTKKVDKTVLTVEQIKALMFAAMHRSYRDYLLLYVECACGLRPSELFAIRVEDVENNQIFIDEAFVHGEMKETKTDDSNAPVPMPPSLRNELLAYIEAEGIADQPRALLFASELGTPMSPNNYRERNLKEIADAAGIERVTFQILRRSFGTLIQKHGTVKDNQRMMRHADPQMTLGTYQQPLEASVHAAATSWADEISINIGGLLQ